MASCCFACFAVWPLVWNSTAARSPTHHRDRSSVQCLLLGEPCTINNAPVDWPTLPCRCKSAHLPYWDLVECGVKLLDIIWQILSESLTDYLWTKLIRRARSAENAGDTHRYAPG